MDGKDSVIRAACARYACRVCRTKTGWPHQRWCDLADVSTPLCADCRYHDAEHHTCAYPARGKGGGARHGQAEYSL